MAVQTSVLDNPGRAYAGQIAEAGAPRYIRSKRAEAIATRAISAGDVVLRGTADDQVIAITDGATVDAATVAGIAVLETSRSFEEAPVTEGDDLSIMRFGVVYMLTTAAVAAGNPLFVGNATAQLGDVDDASGVGLVQVPGCRFLESAGAGEYAAVMVNLS